MKFIVNKCVHNDKIVSSNCELQINSPYSKEKDKTLTFDNLIAYPPFINSHDHLVGNWFPRAGDDHPYATTDIWIEEMKQSASFKERNKIWINDGKFRLTEGNAPLLTQLGMYKNIFSGCTVVQDHGPIQIDKYYDSFKINVIRHYRQCHSLSLGNWWGGKSADEELRATGGKEPFILHLAEGTDSEARQSFKKFEELGLLQPNTIIIHGIALEKDEILKCAEAGTSICCCPESNYFLIGRTIDLDTCLETGVNLVLGTDSSLSGSPSLLHEIRAFNYYHPEIPMQTVFSFFTSNARKALMLDPGYGQLENNCGDLLLIDKKNEDPYENLLAIDMYDIKLLLYKGKPIYGAASFLDLFDIDPEDYYLFQGREMDYFVIGHPEKIIQKIDSILGYHKDLPYLPF
jgi:5-methylthioadenosine/S-adenosylhomocysteine deaminase